MLSPSSSAPLVVVIGATGLQGGSVVTNLMASPKPYRIRGITRDATKAASRALASKGIEMVSCNISVDNQAGIKKAFEGASIIFAVTQFWDHMDMNKEMAEGKMLIDCAKMCPNLSLFIWSGLESITKGSHGRYTHVSHFDGKAQVSEYGRASGIPFCVVQAGFYATNFCGSFCPPRKQQDGSYILSLPIHARTKFPILDTEQDYGKFVQLAIEGKNKGPGCEIYAAGEEIEIGKLVQILAKVTGKNIKYVEITQQQFEAPMTYPDPVKKEMTENFLWMQDFGYFGGKDLQPCLKMLSKPARTWEDFAKSCDWSKVLA